MSSRGEGEKREEFFETFLPSDGKEDRQTSESDKVSSRKTRTERPKFPRCCNDRIRVRKTSGAADTRRSPLDRSWMIGFC